MIVPKTHKLITIYGIRPYSANRWADSYHARDYKKWKKVVDSIFEKLPDDFIPSVSEEVDLGLEVGCYYQFDLDNTLKAYIDALERRYAFNDNKVKTMLCRKIDVDTRCATEYLKVYLLEKVNYNDDAPVNQRYVIEVENEDYVQLVNASEKKTR